MKTICSWLILFCLQLVSYRCLAQQTALIQNGNSSFSIVMPDGASATEQKAAAELKKYIAAAAGANLPVIQESAAKQSSQVYIGKTKAALALHITDKVKDDGFAIFIQSNNVYICGNAAKGTLYGVYDFLERYFNIDYLSDVVISIPKTASVSLPAKASVTSNPSFITRDNFTDMAYNGAWRASHSYSDGYKEWHRINHTYTQWGDDESEWGSFGHTFFQLVPPGKYFASHPEYYSLINGTRQKQQLCLSNPDVVAIATKTLQSFIQSHPGKKYWMVGQEDEGHFCQCDNCKKAYSKYGGKESGLLIEFVNKIAAAIPDKQIATFAYHETEAPPVNIKPAANVMVVIAPIYALQNKPINSTANGKAANTFTGWRQLTSNLMAYNYCANFIDILSPYPNLSTFSPNFRFYKSLGIRHVFAQRPVFLKGSEMEELKAYVLSKLLWNASLNQDSLVKSFCAKYYGAAGPYIVQYEAILDANAGKTKAAVHVQDDAATSYTSSFLAPAYLTQYNAVLDKAADAVKNDTTLTSRVNDVRLGIDYIVLKSNMANNATAKTLAATWDKGAIVTVRKRLVNTIKRENVQYQMDAKQKPIGSFVNSVNERFQ